MKWINWEQNLLSQQFKQAYHYATKLISKYKEFWQGYGGYLYYLKGKLYLVIHLSEHAFAPVTTFYLLTTQINQEEAEYLAKILRTSLLHYPSHSLPF